MHRTQTILEKGQTMARKTVTTHHRTCASLVRTSGGFSAGYTCNCRDEVELGLAMALPALQVQAGGAVRVDGALLHKADTDQERSWVECYC